jgi:hypothetical protein
VRHRSTRSESRRRRCGLSRTEAEVCVAPVDVVEVEAETAQIEPN